MQMPTPQTHGTIVNRLVVLDDDEQKMSAHRQLLHRRIDKLYLSAPLNEEQVTLLDLLEGQERDVSDERRKLHAQINALRAQVGLPRTRDLGHTDMDSANHSDVVAFPQVA
jgi:hypothetical protein